MEAPIDVMISLQPINMVQAAADLLWSPILRKYKDLRFALSEGGIGWIPYALERIDYVYEHHRKWTGQDFGDMLPSQLFKERIITCFIDDAFGIDSRRYMNVDNITWECDYPHSDSTWPTSPEAAMKYLADVPDDEINKITHLNAMRHLPVRPVQRAAPREVHGGRAAGRGDRRRHLDHLAGEVRQARRQDRQHGHDGPDAGPGLRALHRCQSTTSPVTTTSSPSPSTVPRRATRWTWSTSTNSVAPGSASATMTTPMWPSSPASVRTSASGPTSRPTSRRSPSCSRR